MLGTQSVVIKNVTTFENKKRFKKKITALEFL
jgi:hypothetical protein